jgi:hypothetical protein
VEQLVERKLAGENEVIGEKLLQRHFTHHKLPHEDPESNPSRRVEKLASNHRRPVYC